MNESGISIINTHNEGGKGELIPMPTVEITQEEYADLVSKAKELDLLKMALYTTDGYSADINRIKTMFGIATKGE